MLWVSLLWNSVNIDASGVLLWKSVNVYLVLTLVLCGITSPEDVKRQMQAHRLVRAILFLHILQSVLDALVGLLMEQR